MKSHSAFSRPIPSTFPGMLSPLALTVAVLMFSTQSLPGQEATFQAVVPSKAAAQSQRNEPIPLPLSPIEKAEKDGTALRLTLKDLTKLALQNNLDIAIQDTNEEIYQQKLTGAYGPYDALIKINLGVQAQKQPNTNLTNQGSGSFNKIDYSNWNVQLQQSIPTGGGFSVAVNTSRRDTNQVFDLFTPQYTANTVVQFQQPLRRNFRIDQVRSSIKLANLDLKTNDSQFKQKVTDTIANIQQQYWDLVGAIRDYEIKRESVNLAQISLRDNQRRAEIGSLAPINIIDSQAAVANRQVDLVLSAEKIITAENAVRSSISRDPNSEIWSKFIVPAETPELKDYPFQLNEALRLALQNRPEFEQLALQMQAYDINYRLNENTKKWQFDLVSQFGTYGVAGPQGYRSGVPQNDPKLIGGLLSSYKTAFIRGYINYYVGFNLQIPLKNRTVESQLAQIKVQQRQALMTRNRLEQQIQVEVRNAVQRVETSKQSVEMARVARELAQAQLKAEEKRFAAGMSENYRVLDRQSSLSQQQGVELNALISYKKAIIQLQKAMYTLLESNDLEIAKSASDKIPSLK